MFLPFYFRGANPFAGNVIGLAASSEARQESKRAGVFRDRKEPKQETEPSMINIPQVAKCRMTNDGGSEI